MKNLKFRNFENVSILKNPKISNLEVQKFPSFENFENFPFGKFEKNCNLESSKNLPNFTISKIIKFLKLFEIV